MGDEEFEETPRRRRGDGGVPEWAKLAVAVAGTVATTVVTMILWATSTFISRTEMNQHLSQQAMDFARVTTTQENYGRMEAGTASNLYEINSRLTRIETLLEQRPPKNGMRP